VPSNPLEAEKYEIQKEIDKSKDAVVKYEDKLEKLKLIQAKQAGKIREGANMSCQIVEVYRESLLFW